MNIRRVSGCLLFSLSVLSIAVHGKTKETRPNDFVDISTVIPQIQVDMRYYGEHNFTGERIKGYQAPVCLLTRAAVQGLQQVEKHLLPMGLTLKVYDCYRPQQAVDFFDQWAQKLSETRMKTEFYPAIKKSELFDKQYIMKKSGHSRGSTLDVTIVPVDSRIPAYDPTRGLVDCTAEQSARSPDNSLDFGTGYDCFSTLSHPDSLQVGPQARSNRLLLSMLMEQAGFQPLATEWWHFTLKNEPYPKTYFNFPVR
ncbi:MAG: M15 family metallopeptidase [Enterobacteriaceae bacterium]